MEVEERAETGFIEERRDGGASTAKHASCTTHVVSEYTQPQQLHGHLLLTKKCCGVVQLQGGNAKDTEHKDTGENTSQGD